MGLSVAEVEQVGLHRCHVVGCAEDWDEAVGEPRRHCSSIRKLETDTPVPVPNPTGHAYGTYTNTAYNDGVA